MLLAIIALFLGFAGGFFAGVRNANSKKVALAKEVIDKVKK